MASSFPAAPDSIPDPSSGQAMNAPPVTHSQMHTAENDAIEAVEGYLLDASTVTSSVTATAGERVAANATSGPLTVTLPAGTHAGALCAVTKIDSSANTVTVACPTGWAFADGSTTIVLSSQNMGGVWHSDGTSMFIVEGVQPGAYVPLAPFPSGDTTGVTDATTLNAALSAMSSNGGGRLTLPAPRHLGDYYIVNAPIIVHPGCQLVGMTLRTDPTGGSDGTGTRIVPSSTFTGDAVVLSSTWTDGTDLSTWHAGSLEDFYVDCLGIAARGVGIYCMGDSSVLRRVYVQGATGDGFCLAGEQAPATVEDCSSFNSTGGYGLSLIAHPTNGAKTGNGGNVRLIGFGGDLNASGQLHIGGSQRVVHSGLKSEGHNPCIYIDGSGTGGGAAALDVSGFANTSISNADFIKIGGTAQPVIVSTATPTGYTNIVNDTVAGKTLASSSLAFNAGLVTWNGSMVFHAAETQFLTGNPLDTYLGVGSQKFVSALATPTSVGQGTFVVLTNPNCYFMAERNGTSVANGDNYTYDVWLPKGTYTLEVFTLQYTDSGIMEVLCDTVSQGTVDCYAASATPLVATYTVTTTSDGLHTITFKANGKNASSSAYNIRNSGFIFTRTA